MQLWNFDEYPEGQKEIIQPYKFIIGYTPMEIAGGLSYERASWGADATLIYQRWSEFIDSHAEKPSPPFHDTYNFTVSGKFTYLKNYTIMAGGGFFPAPVPAQTGRTNYVDSHIALFSAGHKFKFNLLGRRTEFSADLKTGAAVGESFGLQTNNPGFPGYTAKGWYFVIGASGGVLF